jgi:hypothetical protein
MPRKFMEIVLIPPIKPSIILLLTSMKPETGVLYDQHKEYRSVLHFKTIFWLQLLLGGAGLTASGI